MFNKPLRCRIAIFLFTLDSRLEETGKMGYQVLI